MRKINLILLAVLMSVLTNAAFAQTRVGGRVVEIIDGRTVVIETINNSRITAELQYIEVPEAAQPFHQIAKDHLQALVLDKRIEFRARGLSQTKTVGQLLLNGVDVSQQMIRDGAAWYAVLEKDAQDTNESKIYQSNETQAKAEKLGIWSIANLKPSWQIRAEEEEENRRRLERLAEEKAAAEAAKKAESATAAAKQQTAARPQLNSESQLWAGTAQGFGKLPENVQNVGGLLVGYDPAAKFGFAATPFLKIGVADKDGSQALGVGIAYLYRDSDLKGRETRYLIGVESESRDFRFLKLNDLTVTADGQKILIGKAIRFAKQDAVSAKEMLFYIIKRSVIARVANAKKVELKVGTFSGKLPESTQAMLLNLLKVSE